MIFSRPPKLFGPRHLSRASRQADKILARVAAAYTAKDFRRYKYLTTKYFQSHDARCLAVFKGYKALSRKRRRGLKSNLPIIAKSLNCRFRSDEEVVVLTKKKGEDDYRLVLDFGIVNRARQYLVERVIAATANLHPEQYLTRGGVPAAIKRVASLMLDGYEWAIETDIKQCYPSFSAENMHTVLPLPKEVIDNVIMARGYNLIPGDSLLYLYGPAPDDEGAPCLLEEQIAKARRGIPQGSAVASLAVEILLAPVLKALPSVAIVPSYADNMLTMAKTKEDAVSVTQALLSALQGHPVGPLTPSFRGKFGPDDTIEFLGRRLRLIGSAVHITPSEENEAEFHLEFKQRLSKVKETTAKLTVRRERARDLKRYVSSWTGAFGCCDGMKERKKVYLAKVDAVLAK
jgi:hypothetical protein